MAQAKNGKAASIIEKTPKGDPKAGVIRDILLSEITADPKFNSRRHSDATKDGGSMEELVSSIKSHGLLQPIVVRVIEANKYSVVAGFRRFAAVQKLGHDVVRCNVRGIMSEVDARIANLTENVTREDLFPGELADSCHELIRKYNLSGGEVAKHLGNAKGYVNKLLAMRDELDSRIWKRCFYTWNAPVTQAYLYDLRKDIKDHDGQWTKFCEFLKIDPASATDDGEGGESGEGQGEGTGKEKGKDAVEKPRPANASKMQTLREGYTRLRKEAAALGINLTDADKVALAEYIKVLTWCLDTRASSPMEAKLTKAAGEREKREAAAREKDAKEQSAD